MLRFLMLFALHLLALSAHGAAPQISVRDGHVLALDEAGRVFGWGGDAQGELGSGRPVFATRPMRIPGLPALDRVAAGRAHVLAIDRTGKVWAWGDNGDGQLGLRAESNSARVGTVRGLEGIVQVAAGDRFSAALAADGQVYLWGRNPMTQEVGAIPAAVPGVRGISGIVAGAEHLLLLRRDGTLLALGANDWGQLGIGNTTPQREVVRVPRLSGIKQISARRAQSMALTVDNRVFFWGRAGSQFVSPVVEPVTQPVLIVLSDPVREVVAGDEYAWSLSEQGTLLEFSTNLSGIPVQTQRAVKYRAALTGNRITTFYVYADGTVKAQGYNAEGQAGVGSTREVETVTDVTGLPAVADLQASDGYAVALTASGEAWAWGINTAGMLGDGSIVNQSVPVPIGLPEPAIQVSAGQGFSLALGQSGRVYAWGSNNGGQLGDGTTTRRATPQVIAGLADVVEVSAGCDFSMFRMRDGKVFAAGVLSNSGRDTPSALAGFENAVALAAGCGNAYAIEADGALYGYGRNDYGQISPNGAPRVTFSTKIFGITGRVVRVSAGDTHTVAVTEDGRLWTWGDNAHGQLGSPPSAFDPIPQFIPNLPPVRDAVAARGHTLILFRDGSIGAVGANQHGQLGTGNTTEANIVAVTGRVGDMISIAAGVETSYAVKRDGTTWGWGRSANSSERVSIGDGVYVDRTLPVLVLAANAGGNLDRDDWMLDLAPAVANQLPAEARRNIVPVAQAFGSESGATLTSSINFREGDRGRRVATFVMGLVPRSFLGLAEAEAAENPVAKWAEVRARPVDKADSDLVLVQLTPTGWQVVTGQLTALTTSVVNGNGTSNTILNNINLNRVPNAQFCIGYGESANAMLANQTLAAVLAVPGATSTAGGVPCLRTGTYLSAPESSLIGTPLDFTAIVVGLTPRGSMALLRDGATVATLPVGSSGEQTVETVSFRLTDLATGRYSFVARYSGDGNLNQPSASAPLLHKREAKPTLTLSGPATSQAGELLTFRAELTGSANAQGTVQFKDDGVALGPPVSVRMAGASIQVNNFASGAHTLSAEYSGDEFNAASSAQMVHTVQANGTDTTPEPFSFAGVTGVAPDALVQSEAITVRGINAATAVTVEGGEYSIGCTSAFTVAPSAVFEGDRLCVRHIAASIANATRSTRLTVGGVGGEFRSTTRDDGGGLSAEGDEDGDGIPNGVEVAEGTNPRSKDNDIFANARLFAMQQFRDFLRREGDAGGVAFWTDAVNSLRVSRPTMVEQFVASPEFQTRVAPVTRLYLAFFRRLPDYGGLFYWVDQFASGTPLSSVSQAFAASAEFQATYGTLSNADFIRLAYRNVLGREADATGIAYWSAELGFGRLSRGDLMAAFSESAENRRRTDSAVFVTMVYSGLLKRIPDSAGYAYWVDYRDRGNPGQDLIAQFISSAEYRGRFLP